MGRFDAFPVMAPSDAPDAAVRALLGALDAGAQRDAAADAVAALGERPDPAVAALLREHLQRATCDVGATGLTDAERAAMTDAELADADRAVSLLYEPLAARAALVGRVARALCLRRDPGGWDDLARLATAHPSRTLRLEGARALLGALDLARDGAPPPALVAHVAALADALDLPDTDPWTADLRGVAAEALMATSPGHAFERLAPLLAADPQRPAHAATVAAIGRAWFARMRPADDPRLARALAARMTDPGNVPVILSHLLKQRPHPAVVDGALHALSVTAPTASSAPALFYLFELLAELGDRRAALPVARAVVAFGEAPVPGSAFRALERFDDPDTLAVLGPAATSWKGKRADERALRQLVKRLGRKRSGEVAKAPPQAVAPGLPVWFAPPPLAPPATGDAALDALLVALPDADAAKALARRGDEATAWAVTTRFVEAAEGVCDYTWPEADIARLTPALKGKARRAFSALYGPMNQRLTLLRALAADLARRCSSSCDAALDAAITGLRHPPARGLVAKAAVDAGASRALLTSIADRFETAEDAELRAAAAAAVVALGDDEALRRFGAVLGTGRRALAEAAAVALAVALDGRSDRRWTPLLVADLGAAPYPYVQLAALGALRDAAAVDAVGEATARLAEEGADAVAGVRALHQIGDRRGAAYVLRVLEAPQTSGWYREIAEALRKLGDASLRPRVEALRARLVREREASPWREPEALDGILAAWQ